MKHFLSLFFVIILAFSAWAQDESLRLKHFNLQNKIAIQGYDPVAYFTKNKAEKGNKKFAYTHLGITYYFVNQENIELFKKTPSYYEPQYGGWCAYAIGENGKKVEIDPATFKIKDGKLYLFYNKLFTNTLTMWNKEESKLLPAAEQYWKKINSLFLGRC